MSEREKSYADRLLVPALGMLALAAVAGGFIVWGLVRAVIDLIAKLVGFLG